MNDIEKIIIDELKEIKQSVKDTNRKIDDQGNKLDGFQVAITQNELRSKGNKEDIKKIFNRAWAMFVLTAGSIGSGIFAHFK